MRAVLLIALCACGRLGYDEVLPEVAADGTPDAMPDAAPACVEGTLPIAADSSVCIEIAERGNVTWTSAKADCESLGRRLCADAEWYAGCTYQPTLVGMVDGDFEWVAEESAGVAQKRGPSTCEGMSAHEIFVDPYVYRCCVEKQ
jgi:hypothetical protein